MPHMEQSLLKALQDAVVKVFWLKADMRKLLSTSGVPAALINEQDWNQHKHLILGPILDRLNRSANTGGILTAIMREVLAFPNCDHLLRFQDGPKRKLEAEVALEHLRTMEGFIQQSRRNAQADRDARNQRRAESVRLADFNGRLAALKAEFTAYISDADRQAAGLGLEQVLYNLFLLFELTPRGPFTRVGEQIDGAFALGADHFLLEAKWQQTPVNLSQIRDLDGAVSSTFDNTLGLFLSINGFSAPCLAAYTQGNRPRLICADGADLMLILEGRIPLPDLLSRKKDLAVERRMVFVSGNDILMGRV